MGAWFDGEDRRGATGRNGRKTRQARLTAILATTALASATWALPLPAQAADVEVDNKVEDGIATSAADGVDAGDVTVTNSGSIVVTNGPALTLDSDNDILNEGDIEVTGAEDQIGILIQGGFSGTLTNSGDIRLESADDDDDPLGSNKTGILVEGPDAFDGAIDLTEDSFVRVEGDDSFGLRVATDFTGDITNDGRIQLNGNRVTAIAVEGDVTGSINHSGSTISVRGDEGLGVEIQGDVTGGYVQEGFIIVASPLEGFTDDPDTEDDDDLPEAKGGVWIGGSLGTGFFTAGSYDDGDDDDDTAELTVRSNITADVSRAAVLISPEVSNGGSGNITLGMVDTAAIVTDAASGNAVSASGDDFGFINRGTISTSGTDEGQEATGVDITGWGGFTTTVEGGVKNTGTIRATTFDADATALRIGNDATAETIFNEGTLAATGNGADGARATGILIEDGSTVTTLINEGSISADTVISRNESSDVMPVEAFAIRDLAGQVTTVINEGTIEADALFLDFVDEDDDGFNDNDEPEEGTFAALDFAASTVDVTVTNAGSIVGDITLGTGNDVINIIEHAANADADDDPDTDDEFTSFIRGAVDLGSGTNVFTIDGGGFLSGGLRATGGTVDLTVGNGTLAITEDQQAIVRNATFGADSITSVLLTRDNMDIARIQASGTVTIEDGAEFDLRLQEYLGEEAEVLIIDAATLIVNGDLNITDEETLFFLYDSRFAVSADDPTQIILSLDVKSAFDLGLNENQSGAYDAVLQALALDDDLAVALGNIGNQVDFLDGFQQLLPDAGLAARAAALATSDQNTQAIAARLDGLRRVHHETRSTAWFQAFGNVYEQDESDNNPGFDGETYGVAGGFDYAMLGADAIGVNFLWGGSTVEEKTGNDDDLLIDSLQLGAYAGWSAGPAFLAVQGHGGYNKYRKTRRVVIDGLEREAEGDWDGHQYGASARVGADLALGKTRITPHAGFDYLSMTQNGFTESGGGDGIDLMIDDREVTSMRASAGVEIAHGFRRGDGTLTPRLRFGYVQEFETDRLITTANFRQGTESFDIVSDEIAESGVTAGLGVNYSMPGMEVQIGYDGLIEDSFIRHSGGLTFRFAF